MGFYSLSPLTAGGWREVLADAGLPQAARRLHGVVRVGGREREVELRCLAMLPAMAYLLAPANADESGSLRAWRLAARLVEQMAGAGGTLPDLSRFAAAFPPTAHAAVDGTVETPDGALMLSAHEAVTEFAAAATRALAAAVAEPRLLTLPEAHADEIDLALLQPSLRAVAPEVGAAPPVVRLRDSLEPLELTLELPREGEDARWPLTVTPTGALPARAARIFAPLARASEGHTSLTTAEVGELRLASSALEFAGATVRMPAGIAEEGDLELDEADLVLGPRAAAGSLGTMVGYDLRAALGGREISREEFEALAAASQPLVRLGGQWRVLEAGALKRARTLATLALNGPGIPSLTALGAALSGQADLRGVHFAVDVREGTPLGDMVAALRDTSLRPAVDPAEAFHGELRPYQRVGLGWLLRMRELGLGACLADDMGLGKTVQLIAYLLDGSDRPETPALIVCPTSVLGNWHHELHRFAPDLRVITHHGPERTAKIERLLDADVVVTAYPLLPRDRTMLGRARWRTLVLDEAQQVKNPLTRQAQAARSLDAAHRVALTGTPIENRLDELWSILHVLNPGLLDTRTAFRRRYGTPIERRGDDVAAERLARLTEPFILRRHKSDPDILPDLPARVEWSVHCTLTVEQAALYQATLDTMLGRVRGTAGIERRAQVLTMLTRLKQVCNHPVQALGRAGPMEGRSGKLDRLTEMLAEALDEGDSALVFSQYAVMGTLLSEHLTRTLEIERLYLDGSTPRPSRDRLVARFQEDDGPPRVLVMSLKAGGLGLNLTRASHVFHFDRWWNPAVEDQASDRAHRIGQTQVVQIHRLICAGTIEERIDEMIEAKRDLARRIIDRGAESALSELSDDELTELVELRR